jgi:hypothetical protein
LLTQKPRYRPAHPFLYACGAILEFSYSLMLLTINADFTFVPM